MKKNAKKSKQNQERSVSRLSHLPKQLHPSVSKTTGDPYRSKSKATAKKMSAPSLVVGR